MKSTISLFKSICSGAIIIAAYSASAQNTATWNGAANDFQWNNPINWSWSLGSGIPTTTTDVIVNAINAPINIGPGISANCKNLTIAGGNSNEILIGANSKLNIYGNIIQPGPNHDYISDGAIASASQTNSELNFMGAQSQIVRSVMIAMSKVRINKSGGDVIIDSFCRFFVKDTLILDNQPVSIGGAAKGNLVISGGSLVRDVSSPITKLPAYGENQVPPHIICTEYPKLINGEVSYLVGDILGNGSPFMGINGTVLFPVGESDSSYTPVTVTQTGSNTNAWNVHISKLKPASCANNPVGAAQTVKHGFNVIPMEADLHAVTSTITTPATITIGYNAASNRDVPTGYNTANNTKSAYSYNASQGCWDKLGSSSQAGNNQKTMVIPNQVNFDQFVISANGSLSVPNVGQGITLSMYPNPVVANGYVKISSLGRKKVSLSIVDFTGKKISSSNYSIEKGEQVLTLDTRDLPGGVYRLMVIDDQGVIVSTSFLK